MHASLASGAGERIDLVDFLNQLGPVLAVCKGSGGFGDVRHDLFAAGFFALSPALVAVVAVVAHHLLAAVGDMTGQLCQPVQGIECFTGATVF